MLTKIKTNMITIGNKYHVVAFAAIFILAIGLFVVLYTQNNVRAAELSPINHTYSSSTAGAASTHVFSFTSSLFMPTNGEIRLSFTSGGSNLTGLDYTDVDVLAYGVPRTTAASRTGAEDVVTVSPEYNYISISLGSMIDLGAPVEIRIGTKPGDAQVINPQTNGEKWYGVHLFPNPNSSLGDGGSVTNTITGGVNTGGSLGIWHSPITLLNAAAVNRILTFTVPNGVPVGGKINIGTWASTSFESGFDYTDVDFSVNGSQRSLAAAPSASPAQDGVSALYGALIITIGGQSSIPTGAAIEVKIGSNATYEATGDKKMINPPKVPGYPAPMAASIITKTSMDETIDYGSYNAAFIETNTIQFTATVGQGLESVTPANIELVLGALSDYDTTINYGVTGGSARADLDYTTPYAGMVTIPAGTTTAFLSLPIINDAIEEPDETVILTLSGPTHAEVGVNKDCWYTILNDDTTAAGPAVTILQTGGSTDVTEGGATDTYSVFLATQPTANVVVTINPGSAVTVGTTTLTFTPATFMSPQIITVIAVDDSSVEGAHTATITHTATSTDSHYNGISIPSVTVHITDNDTSQGNNQQNNNQQNNNQQNGTSTINAGTSTLPVDTPLQDNGTTSPTFKMATSTPPTELKFSDVDNYKGKFKLTATDKKNIYQMANSIVQKKTYKASTTFGPDAIVTPDYAIRIALAIAGKSCGATINATSCRAAAIEAKLVKDAIVVNGKIIEKAELKGKSVTRAEFDGLILRAAKLGLADVKTVNFNKNFIKASNILVYSPGSKLQALKPFSRTTAASIVSKLLTTMAAAKAK